VRTAPARGLQIHLHTTPDAARGEAAPRPRSAACRRRATRRGWQQHAAAEEARRQALPPACLSPRSEAPPRGLGVAALLLALSSRQQHGDVASGTRSTQHRNIRLRGWRSSRQHAMSHRCGSSASEAAIEKERRAECREPRPSPGAVGAAGVLLRHPVPHGRTTATTSNSATRGQLAGSAMSMPWARVWPARRA
jgi:hypothetical protein